MTPAPADGEAAALLTRALQVLTAAGVELSAEELLDVLWLAPRLPTGADAPLAAHRIDRSGDAAAPAGDPRGAAFDQGLPVGHRGFRRPVHAASAPTEDELALDRSGSAGRLARVPGIKAIDDQLLLGRALRPLNRRRPVPRATEVDEAATAAAWADAGLPDVVFRVSAEPWLNCAVVVDDGVSMLLWQRLVTELEQLLARAGGFRTVRTYGLRCRGTGPVRVVGAPFAPSSRALPAGSLCDPTGRTLVLVVTDGVGRAWRDGRMRAVLDRCAAVGPVAVLHTLPRRLWPGGAVPTRARFVRTAGRGGPNTAWRVEGSRGRHPAPVPVVELTPASLGDWATLLASDGGEARLDLWQPAGPEAAADAAPRTPEPELAVLDRFRSAASPGAYRLAAYFAALSPLSVPVMRLVQDAVAGRTAADTAMLAEVLLGGLLRPAGQDRAELPQQWREFDFDPEVKHALTEAFPRAELLEVRRSVSRRIDLLAGRTAQFPAWMAGGAPTGRTVRGAAFGTVAVDGPVPQEAAEQEEFADREEFAEQAPGPSPTASKALERALRTPPAVRDSTARPYFYLSYAHTPRTNSRGAADPNLWVAKLYQDLCEAILQITDAPAGHPIGFMDRSMHEGQGSAERLSRELATCRVFVPLYSPRYFKSEACGREWHLFTRRSVYQRRPTAERMTGIVPALWVSMDHHQLPRVAGELHFDHESFGDDYAAEGLYALMKIAAFSSQYHTAVWRLAQRIVDVAEQTVIPTGPVLDLESQPSAFETRPSALEQDRLVIAVFSYRQPEVPPRRDGAWYGEQRTDWQPFRPDSGRPLAQDAADIARSMGFQPVVREFEEVAEELLTGVRPPVPCVLLVDRWALLDGRRAEAVRRLDRRGLGAVAVVEPWNREDRQSRDHERMLNRIGDNILAVSRYAPPQQGDPPTRDGPGSLEEFRGAMERAVMRASAAHGRYPGGSHPGRPVRPTLPGPST
ncbi:TIR-like protein FxsC [Kitasatospora sp. NPDC004531]